MKNFNRNYYNYKKMHQKAKDILNAAPFKSIEEHTQHGTVSVRKHCMYVAHTSLAIADVLKIKVNEEDLIRGALLHDYFQYDWHDNYHSKWYHLHGFYHPGIALRNAKKDFELSRRQMDIIKKHMWPLTVVPPKYREGWIVSLADKYCSLRETFHLVK